jgi:transposase InsO family protein
MPEGNPALEASLPSEESKPRARRKAAVSRKQSRKYTPSEKLVLIGVWKESSLSAKEFTSLIGLDFKTFSIWKGRFEKDGAEGLFGKPPGPKPGSRVDTMTRKSILLLREHNPKFGCERISQYLYRGSAISVSASTVARVLKEEGIELETVPTPRHPDRPRRFERARPNQLWQTDLFCFKLKRHNHMLHVVVYMDDCSRFITGLGVASSATSAFVLEVLRTAVGDYGLPQELLSDRGPQYKTWRGKTQFEKELKKRGIEHIVSRPRHPQTVGKAERFWKTLWNELLEDAVFADVNDARRRIELYVSHYNFQRPHQGIDGLVPADRFFSVESEVRAMLERQVEKNSLELARRGTVTKPFYMTGSLGDAKVSVHSQGEKLVVTREDGRQEAVSFAAPAPRTETVEEPDFEEAPSPAETPEPVEEAHIEGPSSPAEVREASLALSAKTQMPAKEVRHDE